MKNCPYVLDQGTSSDTACPYFHSIVNCEPCGRVFQSHDMYQQHIKSKKHLKGRSRLRKSRKLIIEVVEGVKPPALNAIPYVGRLPKAKIPSRLQSLLSSSQSTKDLSAQVRKIFMPKVFDSNTYYRHFKHLLWIEEYKMESVSFSVSTTHQLTDIFRQDLERYDMPNTTLTRDNNYYQ